MNIQDALKGAGESEGKILNIQMDRVAQPDQFGILRWLDKGILVMVIDIIEGDWQPYHEVKEIRPEKAGELWKKNIDNFVYMTIEQRINELMAVPSVFELLSFSVEEHGKEMIHGKNGWTRLIPDPEELLESFVVRQGGNSTDQLSRFYNGHDCEVKVKVFAKKDPS